MIRKYYVADVIGRGSDNMENKSEDEPQAMLVQYCHHCRGTGEEPYVQPKKLNREEVLRQIEYNISDLPDEDAEGHIWWNKFKELINKL